MPFNNYKNRHLSQDEKTSILASLKSFAEALEPKLANLSSDERKKFGSINEQNKLIVNKVKEYHDTQSTLSTPDVDWVEFNKDFESRLFLENISTQLKSLLRSIQNAKILHDWDNYQASLMDYNYSKYKNTTDSVGFETKVNELKQFFNKTTSEKDDSTD